MSKYTLVKEESTRAPTKWGMATYIFWRVKDRDGDSHDYDMLDCAGTDERPLDVLVRLRNAMHRIVSTTIDEPRTPGLAALRK